MSIIKRNNGGFFPFRDSLTNFFDNDGFILDKLWNSESLPAVNISETDNGYEIEMAVPGMKKHEFKVKVENNMLTITGEHKEEKEDKKKNYTRQEYNYNAFTRSFRLPENAKDDAVQAKYDDGVLHLMVAKKEKTTSKAKEILVA